MFFFYERLIREYQEILTGYQSPPGKRENYGIKVIARKLLPKAANLKLLRLEISERGWAVAAEGNNSAVCPNCATRCRSRHSRYRRKLQDLSVQGSPVTLHLQVCRWRCGNGRCPRG
jgi:transposase